MVVAAGLVSAGEAQAEEAGVAVPTVAAAPLTLPTGDQITDSPGQPAAIVPAAAGGVGGVLVHLGLGGRNYQLPAVALPYLGSGLDLSLFDLDALRAQPDPARIEVQISHQGAAPALPGITMTGDGGGYLTPASAKQFGAALTAQYLEDRAEGTFGGRGLFADGTFVGLSGAATRATAQLLFPMHTLAVTGTDIAGQPDEGDTVIVYNVDDSARFGDPYEAVSVFTGGEARFSVPAGHYAALALYLDAGPDGTHPSVRLVSQPEFEVTADQTVALPASAATSPVVMDTPRPAVKQEGGFVFRRAAVTGPSLYLDLSTLADETTYVAPTSQPVTVGTFGSYPYQRLTSPPGPGTPYEYQLQFASSGLIPAQRYLVRAGSLATVDAYYYATRATQSVRQRAGIYPFEFNEAVGRGTHPQRMPVHQTEYVVGDPSISWFGGAPDFVEDLGGFTAWYGGQSQIGMTYRAGERTREDWNRYPLHPQGDVARPGQDLPFVRPGVTRGGDRLRFNLTPFTDNTPGHIGTGFRGDHFGGVTGHYQLDRDGTVLASGDTANFAVSFDLALDVAPEPATLRLVLDATRTSTYYTQSTSSHTEWIWRSSHRPDGELPHPYVCEPRRFGEPDRNCAVEPLLRLDYAVGDLAVDGSVPAGRQTLDLDVSHLPTAPAAAITGVTVQYSLDDGRSWRAATCVRSGSGHARAIFQALGRGFVSLRITATDAAGGRITETIPRAYRLSRSP